MSYSAQLAGDQAVDGLAIRASGISASGKTRSATETLRQINLFGPVLTVTRQSGLARVTTGIGASAE
jgi:hypothetical protein